MAKPNTKKSVLERNGNLWHVFVPIGFDLHVKTEYCITPVPIGPVRTVKVHLSSQEIKSQAAQEILSPDRPHALTSDYNM